jgi:4-hydroxy-tetrahydrodipicolinate reductase
MKKLSLGISGVSGRIGQRLVRLSIQDETIKLNTGIVSEKSNSLGLDLGEISGIECINKKAECNYLHSDIWIDFSTPNAFDKVLMHCVATKTPLVSGTTGLNINQFKAISRAGMHIPILWASNFSISINLIQEFLSKYQKFGIPSSIEIEEIHHIHKQDAPSGTAISLAQSCESNSILEPIDELNFNFGSIKISSKRQDEVAGIHTVSIENQGESIQIKHSAKTPDIFAQGALNIAKWLVHKKPKNYTMKDYLETLD